MIKHSLNDALGWIGTFTIVVKNKATGIIKEEVIKNRITNTALNALINVLDDIDPNLDIKYIAIGTSSAALNDADTTLGNEVFRSADTSTVRTGIGEFTSDFIVLDSEAIATWEEIGIFCGDAATSAADTGIMLSRILYHRVKTSLEEIQFIRVDKIERS